MESTVPYICNVGELCLVGLNCLYSLLFSCVCVFFSTSPRILSVVVVLYCRIQSGIACREMRGGKREENDQAASQVLFTYISQQILWIFVAKAKGSFVVWQYFFALPIVMCVRCVCVCFCVFSIYFSSLLQLLLLLFVGPLYFFSFIILRRFYFHLCVVPIAASLEFLSLLGKASVCQHTNTITNSGCMEIGSIYMPFHYLSISRPQNDRETQCTITQKANNRCKHIRCRHFVGRKVACRKNYSSLLT